MAEKQKKTVSVGTARLGKKLIKLSKVSQKMIQELLQVKKCCRYETETYSREDNLQKIRNFKPEKKKIRAVVDFLLFLFSLRVGVGVGRKLAELE